MAMPAFGSSLLYVNSASNNCAAATCAATYSPTAGNLVITDIYTYSGSAPGHPPTATTDNATGGSTTYSVAYNYASGNGGNGYYIAEYYSCNVKSGVATITGNAAAGAGPVGIVVTEYSGNATSSCFDSASSTVATGTGTTQTANSITPASGANEVINGFFEQFTNQSTSFATSGSYTLRRNQFDYVEGQGFGVTSQIVASTSGSYSAAASTGSTSVHWYAMTSSYKASAGAAYYATPSESNTASDAIAHKVSFGRGDSESNGASDTIARKAIFGRGDSESNTASDAIARKAVFGRGGSESNVASDSIARLGAFGRGDSESNTASDTVARAAVYGRSDSETNVASDALRRSAAYLTEAVMSESNPASDAIARLAVYGRGNTESNPVSDAISRLGAFGRGEVENPIVHGVVLHWDPSPSTGTVPGWDVGYNVFEGDSPEDIGGTPLNDSPVEVDCASHATCTYSDLTCNTPFETCYYDVEAVWIQNESLASTPSNIVSGTIPAGASDVLASNQALGRSASESNTTADSLDRLAGFRRADSETNPASDLIARLGIYRRGVPEMFAFNDVLVFVKHGKVIVLPRHEFVLPGQTRSGTVPGEVKTGEEPGRVKTGTAPVH